MNRYFICLYILKQSWDTLDSDFRRLFCPLSWKIGNYCYCFLHIWSLCSLFHMNRHFICLYIWKQSWDTLDSDFHLGRHLEFFNLFILDITQQYFVFGRNNIIIKDWSPYWPPFWKIFNGWYWNPSHSIYRENKL